MLRILGADICKDCLAAKIILREKGIEFEYIDMIADTNNLKTYLKFREKHPDYKEVREAKKTVLGIPYFMMGSKGTFDIQEALTWCGEESVEEAYLEKVTEQMQRLIG